METRLAAWLRLKQKRRSQFASELGTSAANVTRWCKGRPPAPRFARMIVAATNGAVSFEDLYAERRQDSAA